MANALNNFPCALLGGNTGFGSCTIDFKTIVGAIIAPTGLSYSAAQTATSAAFIAALNTATSAVSALRAFPIHSFAEIKDNSEAAVTEKLGYGAELTVRDGSFRWGFRILRGGFCLSKALRQFNNMNVDVFFVDASGLVIGQKNVSATGVISFGGIQQYQAYQEPLKVPDGSKGSIYMQNFSFPGNVFDTFGGVQLGANDFAGILGLQTVVLASGGARVANVSLAIAAFSCGGGDLGAIYPTQLNVPALWRIQDSVTGNFYNVGSGITSVAYSALTGIFTITANAADPAYNVGNPVIISLAPASILDAATLHIEGTSFTTPN
jgi:hypothetical protein